MIFIRFWFFFSLCICNYTWIQRIFRLLFSEWISSVNAYLLFELSNNRMNGLIQKFSNYHFQDKQVFLWDSETRQVMLNKILRQEKMWLWKLKFQIWFSFNEWWHTRTLINNTFLDIPSSTKYNGNLMPESFLNVKIPRGGNWNKEKL